MDKPLGRFVAVVNNRILKGHRFTTIVHQHYGYVLSLANIIKTQVATEREKNMASVIEVVGALITRILFFTHGGLVLSMMVNLNPGLQYWYLILGLGLLVLEMLFTLFVRKGHEYK